MLAAAAAGPDRIRILAGGIRHRLTGVGAV